MTEEIDRTKYYVIPRDGKFTQIDLIESSGYRFAAEEINPVIFVERDERLEIGRYDEKRGIVHLKYSLRSAEAITEALRLRDLLDLNKVPYTEKPSRQEVWKSLRHKKGVFKDLAEKAMDGLKHVPSVQ